jgi:phage terminase large subunit
MAAVWGVSERLRILCTREYQNSIKESFHAELKQAIQARPWLEAQYDVGENYIRGYNGTEFLFRGLRHVMGSIKSMAQIDLCIVEEAEDVPDHSWLSLEPTIRAAKSEIWVIWNPRDENSPTDKRFRKNTPPRSKIIEMNWRDNPRFPAVLEEQRHHMLATDPDLYNHVWEGGYWQKSHSQVLNGKWAVKEFTPKDSWDGPYYGQDWGFSTDPAALVKFWRHDNRLYIEHEAYETGVEIDDTPAFNDRIPGAREHVIRADSARPEIISYMQQHGFPRMVAAPKWPGSVEDGISWLRSHTEIVIHPRCTNVAEEARLWSYKVDRQTGDVLPVLKPGHDHAFDAIRYGAAPMIQRGKITVTSEKQGIMPLATYRLDSGVWISDAQGNFSVWEEPMRSYVVGATLQRTAVGGAAIQVIDHAQGEQVACWQGEADPEAFASIIAAVCRRYRNAWAVVDNDGVGGVVISALLKQHKRVYAEVPPGHKTGKTPIRREFGFHAERHIERLVDQLSVDAAAKRDGIKDKDTLTEVNNLRKDQDGKIATDVATPCERAWAYCLARHGFATLPKPRTNYSAPAASNGWAGHV